MALSIIGYAIIFGLLCVGAYTDATKRIIPNWVNACVLLSGLLLRGITVWEHLLNLAVMVIALVIASRATKKKSGGGDIKLYCALSFSLTALATVIILSIASIAMVLHNRIRKNKEKGAKYPVCCYIAPAYLVWLAGSILIPKLF